MIKTIKYLICLLFLTNITFKAIAAPNLAVNQQMLKVGIVKFSPPFVIVDGDVLKSGLDIDLMNKICQELNKKCEYIAKDDDQHLFNLLSKNKIDLVIDRIVEEEVEPGFIASIPYYIGKSRVIALKDSKVNTLGSLNGKKLGYLKYRSGINEFKQKFPGSYEVVMFQDPGKAMTSLRDNDIDALLLDNQLALTIIRNTDNLKLIDPVISTNLQYSIVANASNQNLIKQINSILIKLGKSNFYKSLYEKYIQ